MELLIEPCPRNAKLHCGFSLIPIGLFKGEADRLTFRILWSDITKPCSGPDSCHSPENGETIRGK